MNQEETKQVCFKNYQKALARYLIRLRTIEGEIHRLWQHKILQARYWGATETDIINLQVGYDNALKNIQKDIKTTEQKLFDKLNCSQLY